MMKLIKIFFSLIFLLFSNNVLSKEDVINLQLKDGIVKIKTLDDKAPNHVQQIKDLVAQGRYDGVVVNTTILDSNEHIKYKSYNQKKISQHVSRLFINKDTMPENKAEFSAVIEFKPTQEYEVKFRVSIIEQHKEIESKIIFAKYSN